MLKVPKTHNLTYYHNHNNSVISGDYQCEFQNPKGKVRADGILFSCLVLPNAINVDVWLLRRGGASWPCTLLPCFLNQCHLFWWQVWSLEFLMELTWNPLRTYPLLMFSGCGCHLHKAYFKMMISLKDFWISTSADDAGTLVHIGKSWEITVWFSEPHNGQLSVT